MPAKVARPQPEVTAAEIKRALRALGDPSIAEHSQRFFKTGKGEYGEGDRFIGIRVPVIRKQVARYKDAPTGVILTILKSRYHEERLFAVLSLVNRYQLSDEPTRKTIFDSYLENIRYINNWDLVDSSAHLIVGPWLESRSRKRLYQMARSTDLWTRRVAIMSTYHFIRYCEFDDTLGIALLLLDDDHDLIHKAVGWMLREVGNRERKIEEQFLKKNYQQMPRTMLRYAIEKFPEKSRQAYLKGKI